MYARIAYLILIPAKGERRAVGGETMLEDESLWIIQEGMFGSGYQPIKEVRIELGGIVKIGERLGLMYFL